MKEIIEQSSIPKKEDAFQIHIYNGSGERILGIDSMQTDLHLMMQEN